MDQLLAMRLLGQGGVFTRADAQACGIDDLGLRRMLMVRECVRLARGVYGLPLGTAPAEQRHRHLVHGLLLRYAGRAAAGRHSALLEHGLPVHGVDLARAQLVRLDRSHGASHPEFDLVRRHRFTAPVTVDGRAVMPIAAALAQTAVASGSMAGIVSADAALHRRLISLEDLSEAVAQTRRWPGSLAAQTMLRLADGRSESVGETRLRLILVALKVPVLPQFCIEEGGRIIARSDFRVEGTNLLVEFDGMVKYRGAEGADALGAEKRREDRLRRLGWAFERVIWADLGHPQAIGARIRQACRAAA